MRVVMQLVLAEKGAVSNHGTVLQTGSGRARTARPS